MRMLLPLSALLLSVAAAAAQPEIPPPVVASPPLLSTPLPNGQLLTPSKNKPDAATVCHGKTEVVRQERGLPDLDLDNAKSDEPLLIYAVDQMINGCEVLVIRNDLNDIRPLPDYSDSKATMRPAR
mgnify:CR=1 FL=1